MWAGRALQLRNNSKEFYKCDVHHTLQKGFWYIYGYN